MISMTLHDNFSFIECLWIYKILLVSVGLKQAETYFTIRFNPAFSYY